MNQKSTLTIEPINATTLQHPKGSWCAECEASTTTCGSFMVGWAKVRHQRDCQWAAVFAPTGEHLVFVQQEVTEAERPARPMVTAEEVRRLDTKVAKHVFARTVQLWAAPLYSSNLSAAMEVVQLMLADCDVAIKSHEDGWQVSFSGANKGNEKYGASIATNLPWAICHAALMATGAEDD